MDVDSIRKELQSVLPDSFPLSDELLACVAGGLAGGISRDEFSRRLAAFKLGSDEECLLIETSARLNTKLGRVDDRLITT